MGSYERYRDEYERNWATMRINPSQRAALEREVRLGLKNKDIYKDIERRTGVPWAFSLLTHCRESHFDLTKQLGQGDPLNKVSTHVPKGMGPYFGPDAFQKSAVDAYRHEGFINNTDWSIARTLWRLEKYNGFGYHGKGINSPYLYAGSNLYTKGKYVRDGVFDPNAVDKQLGVAAMLKVLMEMDPDVKFTDGPVVPQPDDHIERGTLWVQRALNKLGANPPLVEDGINGKKTKEMIARFQSENPPLKVDGLAGPRTIAEIVKHLDDNNIKVAEIGREEFDTMHDALGPQIA